MVAGVRPMGADAGKPVARVTLGVAVEADPQYLRPNVGP